MNKKVICAILAFCTTYGGVSAFAYSDCSRESVKTLSEMGILSGYENGTFRPNNLITRAEIAKIISTVTGIKNTDVTEITESEFSDVSQNHWALKYIEFCKNAKLVEGYEDKTFKPDDNITYGEAAKICLTAIGYNNLVKGEESEKWYKPWMKVAYEYKIAEDTDKNPEEKATRLEIAEMISKTINLPLCIVTGFKMTDSVANPTFEIADGTTDENGREKPNLTLYSEYIK